METEVLYDFGKNRDVINKKQSSSKMGDTRPSF